MEESCLICYSDCENKIECGHFYHPECILEYINKCHKIVCCYCFKVFDDKYIRIYKLNIKLLQASVDKLDINAITKLIDLGADVNAKNDVNLTPLMFALNSKYDINIINLLIDSGADINKLTESYKIRLSQLTCIFKKI